MEGGWELQTLIACGCPVPCAYVYVLCEHGTPMYMHMSVCTHMSTEPGTARHCMRTRICASLTCATIDVRIVHMRINQYRPTICVSQSVIFGSNTRSGATTSRPNGLPEKPLLEETLTPRARLQHATVAREAGRRTQTKTMGRHADREARSLTRDPFPSGPPKASSLPPSSSSSPPPSNSRARRGTPPRSRTARSSR